MPDYAVEVAERALIAITALRAKGQPVNGIAMNCHDWQRIRKYNEQSAWRPLPNLPDYTLWGQPVIVSLQVPEGNPYACSVGAFHG